MRSCIELLDTIENNHKDEYEYIVKKCFEKDRQGNRLYFIGFRNNYLELYYKGMCVFKLTENDGKTIYTTNPYYVENDDSKKEMSFDVLKESFETICRQIEKHVSGKHDNRIRREKICQQWIINGANQDLDDWYYLDMEYIDDSNPCGRFDMIAINRKANAEGKHEVVLVELKVKNKSYTGLDGTSYQKKEEKYKKLKENLYNDELRDVKYESGIVSHVADFLRYLQKPDAYAIQLKTELIEMITANKKIGVIDQSNPLFGINNVDVLADKPQIYIVSYSYTPSLDGDSKTKSTIKSMKQSFYNYLYNSEYSLVNMLNPTQIKGFLREKDRFHEFIKSDDRKYCIMEDVEGKEYTFTIAFVDPDEDNPLVCVF